MTTEQNLRMIIQKIYVSSVDAIPMGYHDLTEEQKRLWREICWGEGGASCSQEQESKPD